MDTSTAQRLNAINKEFYQTFANSFSRSRGRIQPGVARVLEMIPKHGVWLDAGCGNGNLAHTWRQQARTGIYYGVDASSALIEHAQKKLHGYSVQGNLQFGFGVVDFCEDNWRSRLPKIEWDGVMMFAVLHHIPSAETRLNMLRNMRALLTPSKWLYISVWQLQNSRRLMQRVQPWSKAGLDKTRLDSGDVLMDWRGSEDGEPDHAGLRYIHLFKEDELTDLAQQSGFQVIEGFYSDGREGNLGLYQCWRAII